MTTVRERADAARAGLIASLRSGARWVAGLPRGARLALVGLAIVGGFIGVVVPLFDSGGAPSAEISGFIPQSAGAGVPVHVDIALDNVGASIIHPVCVAISGNGVALVSANFQGLDQVSATRNTVCGGQLTGQETISITLVLTLAQRGPTDVTMVPQQGSRVIGPAFTGRIAVS